MTMRTSQHYVCPNGHQGEEKTSENDQPYSKSWIKVSVKGMKDGPKDGNGCDTYLCETCGLRMAIAPDIPKATEPGPDIELNVLLEERFSTGQGVIQLAPGMTDAQILTLIKVACSWSKGKAFQVISLRTG